MLIISNAIFREILDRLAAEAPLVSDDGLLFEAKMKLFLSSLVPTQDTLLAAFTAAQPTFTGYAASTVITWGAAITPDNGRSYLVGDTKTFRCTGGTPNEQIGGYYLTDSGGTKLLCAEIFESPILISGDGDGFPVTPVFGSALIAA